MRFPNLNINGLTVERESLTKFLGVRIDKNLTCRDYIHTVENKIAKNIKLLYQGKHYLSKNCRKQINFGHIHVCLNYANKTWPSTHKSKLKKVQSKQKHALRIMFNQFKTSSSEPLFLSLNVFNVYQINIFQSVQCMHIIKNKNVSHIFLKLFGVPCHAYLPNLSSINFSVPRTFLKLHGFAISARDPILWNNYLSKNEKKIDNFLLFKQTTKEKMMELSTAANFFQ